MKYLVDCVFKEQQETSGEICPLCDRKQTFKNHEKDCCKLNGLHIKAHDIMVRYLTQALHEFNARELLATNSNWPHSEDNL